MMKKLLLTLFLITFYSYSFAQTTSSSNPDTIRIISYNIWNGFDWGKEKEREKLFVEYIINEDPEVLALQELCGFTQEKLSKLAKEWGHNYAIIHKENGYPVGITSKKPIELKGKRLEGYGHGMLHVKTYGYDMIITHLNPFNYRQRLSEANKIINYMTEEKLTENTLVMGDLNSHSPADAAFLEANSLQIVKDRKDINSSNGRFDYSVISRFLSYPLIDISQKYVPINQRETYPTLVFWDRNKSIMDRKIERIDFILMTTDLENSVHNSFISNRGATDYLSDHYPVTVDLLKCSKGGF